MEFKPKKCILEFKPNVLQTLRKQYNLDKAGEMDRAIDVLEAWIKMQKHFVKKEFPREYLENAILVNKGSIERAKSKLDKICTYRTIMPELFEVNPTKNSFQDIDEFINVILPKQTESNCRVYILKQTAKTFTTSQMTNYYRFAVLICEYIMAYDCSDGLIIFMDYTETVMIELIKALTLKEMRQIITIVTEGFGMRLKGIHMLTSSTAIETLVMMMKQFLSAKIGNRICVHKDISTLYQYIPKEILPSEYGGEEKSLLKLRNDLMDALTGEEFRKYFEEMKIAKTDESCRQTDKFNEQYMGMPGSFRTLNVD